MPGQRSRILVQWLWVAANRSTWSGPRDGRPRVVAAHTWAGDVGVATPEGGEGGSAWCRGLLDVRVAAPES